MQKQHTSDMMLVRFFIFYIVLHKITDLGIVESPLNQIKAYFCAVVV